MRQSWAGRFKRGIPARADLSEASLRLTNLSGAYLRLADLSGADLRGADLSQANLGGADSSLLHSLTVTERRGNIRLLQIPYLYSRFEQVSRF